MQNVALAENWRNSFLAKAANLLDIIPLAEANGNELYQ